MKLDTGGLHMTVQTQIRIDADLKKQASVLFASLGLDMSTAINLFLHQCVLRKGLPFPLEVPSRPVFADDLTKEELEKEIMKGIQDIMNGKVIPADEAFKILENQTKK